LILYTYYLFYVSLTSLAVLVFNNEIEILKLLC